MKHDSDKSINQVGEQIVQTSSHMVNGIKDAAKSALDSVKHSMHQSDLADDVNDYVHQGIHSVQQAGAEIKAAASGYADDYSAFVRAQPIKSVAIAVGVGMLVSLLLMKKAH